MKQSIVIFFCFLLMHCILLAAQPGSVQKNILGHYVVSRWGMDDGLPQSSVNDILQSKDGYIWLATFGGLVRFDGVSFTTFDRSNTKGMRSDRILALYEGHDGELWCSTEDGFLRFQNERCTTYTISENSQIYSPLMVGEDSRGVLWIAANSKPYRLSNGSFVPVPVTKDPSAARRAVADTGGVWLAYDKEVFRSLGDSIIQILDLNTSLNNNIQDFVEYPQRSGTYWMATSGDGVVQYAGGSITMYSENNGLASRYIRKLYIDRQNNLWVNCFNGLSRWNGSSFVPFRHITSTKEMEYTDIMEDTEGDYWIGTPGQGFYKLRPAIITTIGEQQGIWNDKMLSLIKRKNGKFLFATNCGGVYEWDGNTATYSKLNSFLPNLCVWSLFEDSHQRLWAGSRELYRCSAINERGEVFDSSRGFFGQDVHVIMEDSKNRIWIGCLNGLYKYDGKHFQRYTTTDGLSYNDVRTVVEDSHGTIWIGTTSGLNTFRFGTITRVHLFSSNADSLEPENNYIRAIYEDRDGTMWFGSYGGGLIRLKDGNVSVITTHQGLFDNIVSHIIEDTHQNFWMGSNRGIFRVSKQELNGLCDGSIDRVHSFSYDKADGMESAETNGGFQPSIIFDSLGNIYFPTVGGVAIISTRNIHSNTSPPTVRIEKIFSEGVEIPHRDGITLSPDSTYLEIRYAALSYQDPKKVNFKYRLAGWNNEWINAGSRRSAIFTRLPPGEFTFTVIASNNDGVWNTTGASVSISVLPPYWMSWWFRWLVILVFLSMGLSFYYYRVKQLKKERNNQEKFSAQLIASQEQERRRIAAELHDGLGQQILIIKNRAEMALNTVNDPQKTAEQLREISGSAAQSMNDVRSISHDLRPIHLEQFGLHDTLENLCEQVRDSSTIEWNYHIDPIDGIIVQEKEINFYRIMQEGINNVLKHSSATQAAVMIRTSDEELTASLWDNGKGFDQEPDTVSAGLGLKGIEERVKNLGGSFEIKSHPGEGTTLRIIIPIHDHG